MNYVLAAVAILIVAGCENPMLNVGASVSSDGSVRVSPSVSGQMGAVGVSVSG